MVKKLDGTIENTGNNIKRIIKGTVFSIVITIVLLLCVSALLTYTTLSESTIPIIILAITGISILIGSQISTAHIKKNGVINGGLIGLIYITTIYLISSIVSGNFSLDIYSFIMIAISIFTGAVRGNYRSEYEMK